MAKRRTKRRVHHHGHHTGAIARIRTSTSKAAHEMKRHHMPHSAHAMKVLGSSTAAIGKHVHGWTGELSGMMKPVSLHRKRRTKRKASHHKSHRSPAQKRATLRMLAAARRKRHGGHKRKSHRRSR